MARHQFSESLSKKLTKTKKIQNNLYEYLFIDQYSFPSETIKPTLQQICPTQDQNLNCTITQKLNEQQNYIRQYIQKIYEMEKKYEDQIVQNRISNEKNLKKIQQCIEKQRQRNLTLRKVKQKEIIEFKKQLKDLQISDLQFFCKNIKGQIQNRHKKKIQEVERKNNFKKNVLKRNFVELCQLKTNNNISSFEQK